MKHQFKNRRRKKTIKIYTWLISFVSFSRKLQIIVNFLVIFGPHPSTYLLEIDIIAIFGIDAIIEHERVPMFTSGNTKDVKMCIPIN